MALKIPNALKLLAVLGLLQLALGCAGQQSTQKPADPARPFVTERLAGPVPDDAIEQRLAALPDGGALVYWWQNRPDHNPTLLVSMLTGGHWTTPKPVTGMSKVTDARITPVGDDALAALWMVSVPVKAGGGEVQELYVAFGDKTGAHWRPPVKINREAVPSNKESPVLTALADGSLLAAWIDLPSAGTDTVAIKAAHIGSDGAWLNELRVDQEFCTCCHLALVADGEDALLAYRHLRGDNLRDPALVRISRDGFSPPSLVHDDHWHIDGCPATGPAIARFGATVAVAWLTEVNNRYLVRVAFSHDRGGHFAAPWDLATDVNGVSGAALDGPDSALVAWTSSGKNGEAVNLARVYDDGRVERRTQVLALGDGKAFKWPGPRLAKTQDAVLIAWHDEQSKKLGLARVKVAE